MTLPCQSVFLLVHPMPGPLSAQVILQFCHQRAPVSQITYPALAWPPRDSIPLIPGAEQEGALRSQELSSCPVPRALDLIPDTLSAQYTRPALPLGPSTAKVLKAAANTNSLGSSKYNDELDLEAQACHPSYSGAEARG